MIRFRRVTVRRQTKLLLDAVSLDIGLGEHTAIIGQNGAGKSTLVRLISRDIHPLHSADSELTLFGKQRWNIFELKSKLGIVSDILEDLCRTTYTVHEIIISGFFSSIGIDFSHQVTEDMKQRAFEAAAFMGVSHLLGKQANRTSSGEMRRTLIARAMVNDPSALLLDEPAASLDLKAQAAFKQSLRNIAAAGKSIILVTHDLADILPEMERVVILKDGRVFADGPKQKLLTEAVLTEAFDTKIFVDRRDGWYKAWC